MHVKHLPVLYLYHCGFNFVSDLQNVWTWDTTSLIKKTITFEKALMSFFGRSHMVNICKRENCTESAKLSFSKYSDLYSKFQTIHPDFSCITFMRHEKRSILEKELENKSTYNRRQILTHFCFVLPSNWSWSKYTHFRWNKFLHGSFELIIENCNSREAELSIADMRSSVPSVINNNDRLFFFMQATKEEYRSIDKRNIIDELVYLI